MRREILRDRFGRNWYRFRRNPISLVGTGMVLLVLLLALFAPFVAPYPESAARGVDLRSSFLPPSSTHWFGTDEVGRDVLSRVIFGYRISLYLAVVVLVISVPLGVLLGLLAGYLGGWVETLIMRVTDVFLSIPALAMALAICAAFTPSIDKAMLAVSCVWWTWYCRLVYGIALSVKNEEFVQASYLLGASRVRILLRDILPNCISPVIVKASLDVGIVMLFGAGLSFLGLGVQPPKPGLGTMISYGSQYLPEKWWLTVFPSFALFFLILGFNLFGDGLRDALEGS